AVGDEIEDLLSRPRDVELLVQVDLRLTASGSEQGYRPTSAGRVRTHRAGPHPDESVPRLAGTCSFAVKFLGQSSPRSLVALRA
ncbi:hypothetical protein, partial [Aureimonas leprariae]|uniref:hypothetical protein n=1 Tax=Plantimonas leprariae TaxID=2615207 RepID=UPI001AEDC229